MDKPTKPIINLDTITFNFMQIYRSDADYACLEATSVLLDLDDQLSLRIAYSDKAMRDLTEAGKLTAPIEPDHEITDWANKLGAYGVRPAIEENILTPEQVHSVMRHPLGLQVASERLRAFADDLRDPPPIEPPKAEGHEDSPTGVSVLAASPDDADKAALRSKLADLLESLTSYIDWPVEAASDRGLLEHLCSIQREDSKGKRYRDKIGPALVEWAHRKGDSVSYPTAKAKLFETDEKHWRQVIMDASVRIAITEETESKYPKFVKRLRQTKLDSLDRVSGELKAIEEELGLGDNSEFRLHRLELWERIIVASERFEALVA